MQPYTNCGLLRGRSDTRTFFEVVKSTVFVSVSVFGFLSSHRLRPGLVEPFGTDLERRAEPDRGMQVFLFVPSHTLRRLRDHFDQLDLAFLSISSAL